MQFSLPLLGCALIVLLLAITTHFSANLSDHVSPGSIKPVHVDLVKPDEAIKHLSEILKFKTVSNYAAENHAELPEEFQKLHRSLRKQWPNVFKSLDVQQVADFSLLFEWKGSDPALKPVLCVSHMDVVAVAPLEDRWTHPPFGGVVADGFVWGRGALDLKYSVAGLLEAVSQLLLKGYKPARTVYIAIGHDEEVGGEKGAGAMGRLLAERGVTLDHILDEGGTVLTDGFAPFTKKPVAVVGASEKSTLNVKVSVHGKGGHAMAPPSQKHPSAANRLARIIQQVENSPPTPRLAPPLTWFLHALGASMEKPVLGYLLRRCHVWPLSFVVARAMAAVGGEAGAQTRSTVITTEAEFLPHGNNVIPSLATANFNFRLLPSQGNVEWSRHFLEGIAAGHSKGGSVDVELPKRARIAPLSPIDTTGFSAVRRAILETLSGHEGLMVAPYLMLGSTDSRHYTHLTNNIYRFASFTCNRTDGDLQRVHGVDERVGVNTYLDGVRFYIRYFELATAV